MKEFARGFSVRIFIRFSQCIQCCLQLCFASEKKTERTFAGRNMPAHSSKAFNEKKQREKQSKKQLRKRKIGAR